MSPARGGSTSAFASNSAVNATANLNPYSNKIMNPQLTTLDPTASPTNTKSILTKEGFQCSIITLAPGDETPLREAHDVEEHILFAIEGEPIVRFGDINTMMKKDEALLVPKNKAHLIAAGPNGWAKILRVDVPPRQVVTPQILTIDR